MLAQERRRIIAEHVSRHGRAEVAELSAMFGVSAMTVRRDLDALARSGVLARSWGGALVPDATLSTEMPYALKRRENEEAKRRIGQYAAGLVQNGDVVILDAGSTTFHIATHLRGKRDVTVVTNDLKIAVEVAPLHGITLVVTVGGIVQPDTFTMLGPQAEAFLSGIHANRAFLGADAVDVERGASTRTLHEVAIKQAMIAASAEAILVADHSKFQRQAFARFCHMEDLALVITDRGASADLLDPLSERVRMAVA